MTEYNVETLQKETQLCKKTSGTFMDEEESLSLEGNEPVKNRIEGDGNNALPQRRLGLDIGIVGAREETLGSDRISSTTPGAEPPRDARDSGSARSHSTHLETSSSDRP